MQRIERRQIHLVDQVADVVDEVVWRQPLADIRGQQQHLIEIVGSMAGGHAFILGKSFRGIFQVDSKNTLNWDKFIA